jgi:HEPN domain-containing protein
MPSISIRGVTRSTDSSSNFIELPAEQRAALDPWRATALALDKLYLPTRYPDALGELVPAEAYTSEEAEQAPEQAAALPERVRATLP